MAKLRGGVGLVAIATLLLVFVSGSRAVDARQACLRSLRVVNGGRLDVLSLELGFVRPLNTPATLHLGGVGAHDTRTWGTRRCVSANGVTLILCVAPRGRGQPQVFVYTFPRDNADRILMGTSRFRAISVNVGETSAGETTAFATFLLWNGKVVVRQLNRGLPGLCARHIRDYDGEGGVAITTSSSIHQTEPEPFVRIRLANGSDKEVKKAQARGYIGAAPKQTLTLPDPYAMPSVPIPPPTHDYDDAGAHTVVEGALAANKVMLCVRYDADGNGMIGPGEFYNGTYSGGWSCRIERVDFEVKANHEVWAYVVMWPSAAGSCSNLTPEADLPASHQGQGLAVKAIQLTGENSCAL